MSSAPIHSPSIVEETLRSQRDSWQEIAGRVSNISSRELPHEQPKRILMFGLGSSHFAAKLCAFALIRDKSRVRIPVIACSSTAVGVDVIPQPGDWAFGFTHRGTSAPTLHGLLLAQRSGAFTIMVSGNGAEVPEHVGYALHTVPMEKAEPHTASMTGAICAVTCFLLGNKAVEEWDAIRSIGEPDLDLLRRRCGDGPDVLLGEWEGEWLAREGALKLMEMARLPVRAFGSEEYFHGPCFSCTSETKLWHVSLPKDARNDEINTIRPAHTIGIFGSTPLAWMPALVELQWLALAVALNRGVNPDNPRG